LQVGQEQVELHATIIGINADQDLLQLQRPNLDYSKALGGRPVVMATDPGHDAKLLVIFQEIVQPPAAIFMGRQRRWRRLRRYLVGLSTRAALHALLCVVELLGVEQISS
jgi:hypothetical protein